MVRPEKYAGAAESRFLWVNFLKPQKGVNGQIPIFTDHGQARAKK